MLLLKQLKYLYYGYPFCKRSQCGLNKNGICTEGKGLQAFIHCKQKLRNWGKYA
jgi:hypothetical protein